MALSQDQREALLRALEDMPQYLERELLGLTLEQTHQPGPDGAFSPVEQVWHLADLEREGFGWRGVDGAGRTLAPARRWLLQHP